jgi:hypothetical protein
MTSMVRARLPPSCWGGTAHVHHHRQIERLPPARAQRFEIVGAGSRPPWRVLRCTDEMIDGDSGQNEPSKHVRGGSTRVHEEAGWAGADQARDSTIVVSVVVLDREESWAGRQWEGAPKGCANLRTL